MKKITRPWQATFLALFGSIKFSLNIILLFFLTIMKDWFAVWLSQFDPNLIVVSAIKPSIFIPLILSIIFLFFVIRGLWKGQKWVPICLTCIHGLALLINGFLMFSDWPWVIPFGITLFLLALDIECWRHPFFNLSPKKG